MDVDHLWLSIKGGIQACWNESINLLNRFDLAGFNEKSTLSGKLFDKVNMSSESEWQSFCQFVPQLFSLKQTRQKTNYLCRGIKRRFTTSNSPKRAICFVTRGGRMHHCATNPLTTENSALPCPGFLHASTPRPAGEALTLSRSCWPVLMKCLTAGRINYLVG